MARNARNIWVRTAATSAMLALLAGCGSSGGADGDASGAKSPTKTGSASPSASADSDAGARSLTETQLTKALLEQGDLADYRVQDVASPDIDDIPASDPDEADGCAAVIKMMFFALGNTASEASAARSVSATTGATAGTGTSVLLSSYRQADAEQGMADLKSSVAGCPDGFEVTGDLKASAVKPLDAPDVGDDAVAFRLTGGVLGEDTPTAYTVVRSGSTVAVFFAVDVKSPQSVEAPAEVVKAQVAKLEKVTG